MAKVDMVSTDSHNPLGGVVRVNHDRVNELEATGKYKLKQDVGPVPVALVEKIPDETWTEREIKQWIQDKGINVSYDIKRDTKKEILERLKEGGYI